MGRPEPAACPLDPWGQTVAAAVAAGPPELPRPVQADTRHSSSAAAPLGADDDEDSRGQGEDDGDGGDGKDTAVVL